MSCGRRVSARHRRHCRHEGGLPRPDPWHARSSRPSRRRAARRWGQLLRPCRPEGPDRAVPGLPGVGRRVPRRARAGLLGRVADGRGDPAPDGARTRAGRARLPRPPERLVLSDQEQQPHPLRARGRDGPVHQFGPDARRAAAQADLSDRALPLPERPTMDRERAQGGPDHGPRTAKGSTVLQAMAAHPRLAPGIAAPALRRIVVVGADRGCRPLRAGFRRTRARRRPILREHAVTGRGFLPDHPCELLVRARDASWTHVLRLEEARVPPSRAHDGARRVLRQARTHDGTRRLRHRRTVLRSEVPRRRRG